MITSQCPRVIHKNSISSGKYTYISGRGSSPITYLSIATEAPQHKKMVWAITMQNGTHLGDYFAVLRLQVTVSYCMPREEKYQPPRLPLGTNQLPLDVCASKTTQYDGTIDQKDTCLLYFFFFFVVVSLVLGHFFALVIILHNNASITTNWSTCQHSN